MQFGRRTTIKNLHITLVFLGSVKREQRECLEWAAGKIQPSCFTMHVDQLDYWTRPKILWAGCSEIPDELQSLVGQLKESASACMSHPYESGNMEELKRDYVPHVTLARKVNSVQGNQYCKQHSIIDRIEWRVSHFSLMESITYAEGPVYKILQSW